MVELPKGDFGFTIVRQFLFDAYSVLLLDALSRARDERLAAIAAKCLKEDKYHLRHSSEWVVRLGDGTDESHARVPSARWTSCGATRANCSSTTRSMPPSRRRASWSITRRSDRAGARWWPTSCSARRSTLPADGPMRRGGRTRRHTEHLGHMLAEMQIVARSHPGATW